MGNLARRCPAALLTNPAAFFRAVQKGSTMRPDHYQKLINSLNIEREEQQQPSHAEAWTNPEIGPENSIVSLLQMLTTVPDSLGDELAGPAAEYWLQMLEGFQRLIGTTTGLGRIDRSILHDSVEVLKTSLSIENRGA